MKRHSLIFAALFGAACAANAQDWPSRTVKFIVSQAPGTSPDITARYLADRLSRLWNQQVVVENRPGGQNVPGAQAAARSAPDGYTYFYATTAAIVSNPLTFKALPYDPARDFVPVAMIAKSPMVIAVNPAVAAKSLTELVALDRAQPGRLEHFQIACAGDVDIDPGTLTARESVEMERRERPAASAPWGAPARLWADTVTATGTHLLSNAAAGVTRIRAEGHDAAFESGEGKDLVQMWSRTIDIDVPAGTATLTGEPGRDVEIKVGDAYHVEHPRAVFDFRAGRLKGIEGPRIIVRGRR